MRCIRLTTVHVLAPSHSKCFRYLCLVSAVHLDVLSYLLHWLLQLLGSSISYPSRQATFLFEAVARTAYVKLTRRVIDTEIDTSFDDVAWQICTRVCCASASLENMFLPCSTLIVVVLPICNCTNVKRWMCMCVPL